MTFARKALLVFLVGCALFLPAVSYAAGEVGSAGWSIIPDACKCDSSQGAMDFGCVIQTTQNLMNFGVYIAIIIMTLALSFAGFLWIFTPISAAQREQARTVVTNAVIGIVIVLSAWLVVDFVMKALYGDGPNAGGGWGPWNEIIKADAGTECIVQTTQSTSPATPSSPAGSGVTTTPNPSTPTTPSGTGGTMTHSCTSGNTSSVSARPNVPKSSLSCANCVALTSPVTCTNNCNLNSSVASKIQRLASAAGSLRVTEAFPPSTCVHSNSCHYDGTCVDTTGPSNMSFTATNVKNFINTASSNGFRAIFETGDCGLRDQVRAAGVPNNQAFCRSDSGYGGITGNHFSLYSN